MPFITEELSNANHYTDIDSESEEDSEDESCGERVWNGKCRCLDCNGSQLDAKNAVWDITFSEIVCLREAARLLDMRAGNTRDAHGPEFGLVLASEYRQRFLKWPFKSEHTPDCIFHRFCMCV